MVFNFGDFPDGVSEHFMGRSRAKVSDRRFLGIGRSLGCLRGYSATLPMVVGKHALVLQLFQCLSEGGAADLKALAKQPLPGKIIFSDPGMNGVQNDGSRFGSQGTFLRYVHFFLYYGIYHNKHYPKTGKIKRPVCPAVNNSSFPVLPRTTIQNFIPLTLTCRRYPIPSPWTDSGR